MQHVEKSKLYLYFVKIILYILCIYTHTETQIKYDSDQITIYTRNE